MKASLGNALWAEAHNHLARAKTQKPAWKSRCAQLGESSRVTILENFLQVSLSEHILVGCRVLPPPAASLSIFVVSLISQAFASLSATPPSPTSPSPTLLLICQHQLLHQLQLTDDTRFAMAPCSPSLVPCFCLSNQGQRPLSWEVAGQP